MGAGDKQAFSLQEHMTGRVYIYMYIYICIYIYIIIHMYICILYAHLKQINQHISSYIHVPAVWSLLFVL